MRLCRNARIHTPKSIVMYENRNPSRVAWSFLALRASKASRRPTVSRVRSVGDRFSGTGASTSTFAGCPMAGRLPFWRHVALSWRHASLPFGRTPRRPLADASPPLEFGERLRCLEM